MGEAFAENSRGGGFEAQLWALTGFLCWGGRGRGEGKVTGELGACFPLCKKRVGSPMGTMEGLSVQVCSTPKEGGSCGSAKHRCDVPRTGCGSCTSALEFSQIWHR